MQLRVERAAGLRGGDGQAPQRQFEQRRGREFDRPPADDLLLLLERPALLLPQRFVDEPRLDVVEGAPATGHEHRRVLRREVDLDRLAEAVDVVLQMIPQSPHVGVDPRHVGDQPRRVVVQLESAGAEVLERDPDGFDEAKRDGLEQSLSGHSLVTASAGRAG
jgi:hypothetical protein